MFGNKCGINLYHYFSQVDTYLRTQQEQIRKLKEEITTLKETINQLRENRTTNIDKIEYKFDQLKIERLEGTLNIGLSPQGMADPEAFENFSVNQNPPSNIPILQQHPDLYPTLKQDIRQFMATDCQQFIDECAAKYNMNLGGPHRSFITQDIERQLDARLHHYLNQAAQNHLREGSMEEIFQFVSSAVKKDIVNAIDAFVKHIPMGGSF
ncbi:spore germination protein GerPC [Schinkia azotoformans]|uniref:Spore germination protein GerPC n=1 Tax=Schinkia azotoformans LMG 9581 TaxID=1131731 RepID=K6D5H2_SCHAZ|nr:spore germination protein GerPC [Schinkia azotoformans]EKN63303.1 spore germination protein GerPC [Schinkia azotoformans LMG 9581]MEC1640385.1 spore germination protein GerPC [Schinkia azotoformans]MEC1719338.1 spore germination protein GerPC [Schinkia azotoformans]MEC1946569.1 spore germination protein GerPC [Schinkia azotoformans]MED4353406.1 spore germination protein GerPC [Schinkia azotoformans]